MKTTVEIDIGGKPSTLVIEFDHNGTDELWIKLQTYLQSVVEANGGKVERMRLRSQLEPIRL